MSTVAPRPSPAPGPLVGRGEEFLALYTTMRNSGQLRRYLLVEYRCAHPAACLLARVYATPRGLFSYRPAHTFSVTATTPYRVDRRREAACPLPDPPLVLRLACDHVIGGRDARAVLADVALARRTGRATGRRISASAVTQTGR